MKKEQLKITGYVVLAILVLNMIIFALGWINDIVFWVIIALGALFVYKGLPMLKK